MTRDKSIYQETSLRYFLLPSLTYYLKLLALPNVELEGLIQAEIDSNPLLEEITPEPELEDTQMVKKQENIDELGILDLYTGDSTITDDSNIEEEFDPMENIPAQNDKLYDYLMRQAERKFKDRDLEIAELIISNIEDDGYLAVSPEELSQGDYKIEDIQRIRKEIQLFDPPGCAWREIKEALLAQLEKLGYPQDSVEYIIVRDYLPLLNHTNGDREILKKLNIGEERLNGAKRVLMKLDPRPGLRYSSAPSGYIIPDFIISWQDDNLVAQVNDDNIPRIRIKAQYIEKIKHPENLTSEELEFLKKKLQSAKNLIVAIEKRRKTLSKIINNLLEYQREYFLKGPNYLKPITMVEFAKRLGVNPSTVSRAVANKYIESPRGIHKAKFFFTAPIGNKMDKRYVMEKIKEIIEHEDKNSPFSDSQIAKKLIRLGIIISRRTVTKYREQLNIPSNQCRRII
ncbi:MAG: RNA polymerase factor sigma-54 [candidate division WOR-3 bacterium]